jgi:hypothetical protein
MYEDRQSARAGPRSFKNYGDSHALGRMGNVGSGSTTSSAAGSRVAAVAVAPPRGRTITEPRALSPVASPPVPVLYGCSSGPAVSPPMPPQEAIISSHARLNRSPSPRPAVLHVQANQMQRAHSPHLIQRAQSPHLVQRAASPHFVQTSQRAHSPHLSQRTHSPSVPRSYITTASPTLQRNGLEVSPPQVAAQLNMRTVRTTWPLPELRGGEFYSQL